LSTFATNAVVVVIIIIIIRLLFINRMY
jgi:hypothetical protein